jgi:Pyruvate/2-oxoacid:ferredoxin oxidoreductase delta subunit
MAVAYHSLRTLCEEVEGGLGSLSTSIPMILVGREDMERRAERRTRRTCMVCWRFCLEEKNVGGSDVPACASLFCLPGAACRSRCSEVSLRRETWRESVKQT